MEDHRAREVRTGAGLFEHDAAAHAETDRAQRTIGDGRPISRNREQRVQGHSATGAHQRKVAARALGAGEQFVELLVPLAIADAVHVGDEHHIIFAGGFRGHVERVAADAEPVGLHEDDGAGRVGAVIPHHRTFELPAVILVRHHDFGHLG